MGYNIKLTKKDQFTPTFWSGGMATELTTYPEGSSYAARDFLWRLGFAKIDIPESTFSNLPGVSRTLMLTTGKMTLTHEGMYSKTLGPFEQDSFSGEWKTTTKGQSSVFNLMTRENYSGELIYLSINPSGSKIFSYSASYEKEIVAICIFPLCGTLKTKINHDLLTLKADDLLILNPIGCTNSHKFDFINSSKEVLNAIVSVIYRI